MTEEPFDIDGESLRYLIKAADMWLKQCPDGETVYSMGEIRVSSHGSCESCKGTGWVPK